MHFPFDYCFMFLHVLSLPSGRFFCWFMLANWFTDKNILKKIWKCKYIVCTLAVYFVYMSKKTIVLDASTVRKNIDLPQWAVDEFDEMAQVNRNKFKPFVELTLINIARKYIRTKNTLQSSKQSKK